MLDEIEHINPKGARGPSRVTIRVEGPVSIGEDVVIGEGVFMSQGTTIGAGVAIGNNCEFGPDVRLADNVTIGNGSRMAYTTIGERSCIGVEARFEMSVQIGADTRIGNYCYLGPMLRIENGVIIGDHFTTVSYTIIRTGCQFGDYVHLDRDITAEERVIIENGCAIFGKQIIPDRVRVAYAAPRIVS